MPAAASLLAFIAFTDLRNSVATAGRSASLLSAECTCDTKASSVCTALTAMSAAQKARRRLQRYAPAVHQSVLPHCALLADVRCLQRAAMD